MDSNVKKFKPIRVRLQSLDKDWKFISNSIHYIVNNDYYGFLMEIPKKMYELIDKDTEMIKITVESLEKDNRKYINSHINIEYLKDQMHDGMINENIKDEILSMIEQVIAQ